MTEDLDLEIQVCEACHSGAPALQPDEIERLLPQVSDWEKLEIDGEPRLQRTFTFKGWLPAVQFVNAVAQAAEENDHHPRITLDWGKVRVEWWTHAIKGLHKNDFIMAAKTDRLA